MVCGVTGGVGVMVSVNVGFIYTEVLMFVGVLCMEMSR